MTQPSPAQSPHASSLNAEYGVLDTAFLLQAFKEQKWLIVRATITLAMLAMLFTLKPDFPSVKATLRVDPPAGRTISLGNMYNVDTEIGSIKSFGMVMEALGRAQYYALVTPITVKELPSKLRADDDKPGALHFSQLYFPKAMEGREWMIEITSATSYELQAKGGQRIAKASIGEIITGTAHSQSKDAPQDDTVDRYRIQVNAIEAEVGSRFAVRPMQAESLAALILSKLSVSKRNGGPGSNLLDIELSLPDVALTYHMVQYITQHYILQSIDRQSAAQQQAIDKLESMLVSLKTDVEMGKQSLLDFYSSTQAAEPDLELRNLIPKRSELQTELQNAEVKLTQLQLIYTEKHPALKAVHEEVALLQTRLQEVNDLIATLPVQQSTLDQLKRELAISTDLYQTAIKELARVQLETNSLPQSVHLIDAPRVQMSGRTKFIVQLVIFGGMLGFISGIAIVLLSASVRLGRLYSLKQLAGLTRLGVHQSIFSLRKGALDDAALAQLSQMAQYSFHTQAQQRIALCAPAQDDATARLSIELAAALGQQGKRVLLLDAHVFRSPLTPMLDKQQLKAGFCEWMTGRMDAAQAIQETSHTNVAFMPCGRELANYDLLSQTEALGSALLALPYDAVLVFLPPASALPNPNALLSGFSRIVHWIRMGQTLEQIQRYLLHYGELATPPTQGLYVYDAQQRSRRYWRKRRPDRRQREVLARAPQKRASKAPPSYGKAAARPPRRFTQD